MAGIGTKDGESFSEDNQNDDLDELCKLLQKNKFLATAPENLRLKYPNLTVIDVSNNELDTLPEAIGGLLCLEVLKAESNILSTLPSSLSQLIGLRELHLSHNKISSLPDSFTSLQKLELINLSHNELVYVPFFINVGCSLISCIDFSHNHLSEWDIAPMCIYSLKILNVSYNKLQSNPAWLWGDLCYSLEELDLSNNDLMDMSTTYLPNQVWRTGINVVLQELNLANCGISPKSMSFINQLQSVKKLNIGNNVGCNSSRRKKERNGAKNAFWEVPLQSLSCKMFLTELVLCDVGVSMLPHEISALKALEVLDCRENKMQWLPDSICEMSCLRIVNISRNKILLLPPNFGKLSLLEELYMDNNQVEQLPETLSELQNLLWLDLYGNQLEEIPPALDVLLPNLQGLDLGYNFFDVRLHFEEKIGALSFDSYMALRKNIRQRIFCDVDPGFARTDNVQIPPHYPSSEDLATASSYHATSDEDNSSEPSGHSAVDENEFEDEMWDLEDANDDNFDPTYIIKPQYQPVCRPHELMIMESIRGADTFCPADIHAPPTIRPSIDHVPHDGQFEDA